MPWTRMAGAGVLATAGALAARYAVQRSRIERSWPTQVTPRLAQIGEVDQVSILPLVERLVPGEPSGPGGRLHGEPGVAYLIRAGTTTVLFDVGFNPRGRAQSALAGNADTLQVQLGSVDAVVISHLHADHVGGLGNQRRRTYSGSIPCCASTTAVTSCGTAGPATFMPSGSCPPWQPSGTTPTAGHAPTWPAAPAGASTAARSAPR